MGDRLLHRLGWRLSPDLGLEPLGVGQHHRMSCTEEALALEYGLSPAQAFILRILAEADDFVKSEHLSFNLSSLKVQISTLRRKMRPHGVGICNKWGSGYKLDNAEVLDRERDELDAKILCMYRENVKQEYIAATCKVSIAKVARVAAKAGLMPRGKANHFNRLAEREFA